MLGQINMHGTDKVQTAIERLKRFEPEDGYYLAFSGGKDSVTIKALADMAGVKYDAHYRVTSVDPPELVQFVKTFPDVSFDFPRYKDGSVVTMWNLIPKEKVPPTRIARYCCKYFKENGGDGRFKVTGIRWAESVKRRKNRAGLELSNSKNSYWLKYDADDDTLREIAQDYTVRMLNPIIDWSDEDVWEFIRGNGIKYCELYDEGFKRLGCVGCPFGGRKEQCRQFERWGKYRDNYVAAFDRMLDVRHREGLGVDKWDDAEAVMRWWLAFNEE